jgi:hypothetical protein
MNNTDFPSVDRNDLKELDDEAFSVGNRGIMTSWRGFQADAHGVERDSLMPSHPDACHRRQAERPRDDRPSGPRIPEFARQ